MHFIRRRNFIQGLGLGAGSHLLGAMVRKMLPEAMGVPPAKRYIQMVYGCGIQPRRYRSPRRSETDFDMPEIFAPFSPFRDKFNLIETLHGPGGLHGSRNLFLAGGKGKFPTGPSLDRLIAQAIGDGDPFSSTNLAYWCDVRADHVSADGADKEYTPEWNPIRAYERFFGQGGAMPVGGSAENLLADDRRVLDAIRTDIQRTQSRLAGTEREKLEQYLTSLVDLENQLVKVGELRNTCSLEAPELDIPLTRPGKEDGAGDKKSEDIADFKIPHRVYPELTRAFTDLTFNVQLCGLTHVSSFALAAGEGTVNSPHTYAFVHPTARHHTMCHDANDEILTKIDQFVAGEMAYLWDRMKSVEEGDGKMADNALGVFTNIGGGHHGDAKGRVVVLLGDAGGKIQTAPSGRYLQVEENERAVGDLWMMLADAMGADGKKFEEAERYFGPMPGILA